ncbi:MAG: HAMP domain-containing sensor histidine kinase [Candidatus Melainabacteria bacterium]|nr:HAMP domain-containing sensor histidine kinase [Candidatus Melainabacteria bacterium]
MKFKFPLFAQIICVFVLNLALLSCVHFVFFSYHFNVGWEATIYRPVAERLQMVSFLICRQLESQPRGEWNQVLRTFGESYNVKFYLFDSAGKQIAGEMVELPDSVRARLMNRSFRPSVGTKKLFVNLKPPVEGKLDEFKEAPLFVNVERLTSGAPHPMPPLPGFFAHTSKPECYWIGALFPLMPPVSAHSSAAFVTTLPSRPATAIATGTGAGAAAATATATTTTTAAATTAAATGHIADVSGPGTLVAATPNIWQTRLVSDFGNIFLIGLGVIALSSVIWWPFVFFMTHALGRLTFATEKIADGNFDILLKVKRWDEIGRLAQAVNVMAGKLKASVNGQKRFLGDIAHELCSPIARLQIAIEILERSASQDQKGSIDDIREEVEQMSLLINELLAFSKAGLRETELHAVDLDVIVKAAASKAGGGDIIVLFPESLTCLGDEVLLERAFGNVLRNAVRYAGDAGPITVKGEHSGDSVYVTVVDCGPGVPPEAIEFLGQPFYRPEASRTRTSGGVGLGLSIVKTCIEACGGRFSAQNNLPNGLKIEIVLRES